jgi:hypothetical protein
MILRSSWLPARIPFTVLLLPLFWIILLLSPNLNEWRALWILITTHVLLYSAVNIYVNFYQKRKLIRIDKKENKSISFWWLYVAIGLHAAAVVSGILKVNYTFGALVLLYGITAHAYGISIEQREKTSDFIWGFVRLFQGIVGSLLYYSGLNGFTLQQSVTQRAFIPGIITALLVAAFFSNEESSQTDTNQTFLIRSKNYLILFAGAAVAVWFFSSQISAQYNAGIIASFAFGVAILLEKKDANKSEIKRKRILWINWIGAIGLNIYAFYLFTDYTQVLQLIH